MDEVFKNYKQFGGEFEDIVVLSKILPTIRMRSAFEQYAGKGYRMLEEQCNRVPVKRNSDQ